MKSVYNLVLINGNVEREIRISLIYILMQLELDPVIKVYDNAEGQFCKLQR